MDTWTFRKSTRNTTKNVTTELDLEVDKLFALVTPTVVIRDSQLALVLFFLDLESWQFSSPATRCRSLD